MLAGSGEMGERIRAFDWASTPLGPLTSWSPALHTMVRFLLANRFPLLLWWGPQYIQLYNDAYRPIPGAKHPDQALDRPASECWTEIWHVIGPLIDTPFHGGPATWMEDIELEINRHGFVEEPHFTIAYSPVPDDTVPSGIGGVLATVHEISEKVVSERRVLTLRDLAARSGDAKTAEEACSMAADTLAHHLKDMPFSLLYLLESDGLSARLAGSAGMPMGGLAAPALVNLTNERPHAAVWPLVEAVRTEGLHIVESLIERLGEAHIPPSPWSDPPRQAVIVPIRSNVAHQLAGFLVAGVSPRLNLDELYRSFYELVASQMATALANARAYEEEKKRAEALAEIDRAKTQFFSNISHEFRTPLTLMLGSLEEELTERPAAPSLQVAHRNSLRLLKLVNQLLDFSRIEAGRAQARYVPTDLARFTEELTSLFRSAMEKGGLRLSVECPPLAEPVYVDRDMWEKIVLNLLSNAFKFTFVGDVAVSLRPVDGYVELIVRDTGIGIAAEDLSRLFERFHRIEGVQGRTHEGTGIGLALVQELVKLHNGSIDVDSIVGRGSTFRLRIPFGTAHLPKAQVQLSIGFDAVPAPQAAAFNEEALRWLPEDGPTEITGVKDDREPEGGIFHATSDAVRETRPRVLMADDNADMRQYLVRLLSGRYDVEPSTDGEAALIAARRQRPDLILTDVMMPKLDGYALLRAVRQDVSLQTVPVILISARADEESRIEGLKQGADDYLVKPFSARELLARVEGRLEITRVRNEADNKVRASEERLRLANLATNEAIWDWDVACDTVVWNQNADRLFGWAEAVQSPRTAAWWVERVHPEDRTRVVDHFFHAVNDPAVSAWSDEYRFQKSDGTYAHVLDRGCALRDTTGQAVRMLGTMLDVTERKQAEAQLRESEVRLRAILDRAPAAIFIKDRDGRSLFMNQECARVLNVDLVHVQGKTEYELYPTVLAEQFRSNDTKVWESGQFQTLEEYVPMADSLHTYVSQKFLLRDAEDTPYALCGIAVDITPRLHMEQTLRESRDRLTSALQAADIGTWRVDLKTGLDTRDAALNQLLGLDAVDTTTPVAEFFAFVYPDDQGACRAAYNTALERTHLYDVEHRIIRADGVIRWVRDRGRIMCDEHGTPCIATGAVLDITERKKAEELLQESESRFRSFFENAAVGAAQINPAGRFIHVNDSFCRITGYARGELLGKMGPLDLDHPDEIESDKKRIADFFQQKQPYLFYEKRYLHKDGHIVWVRVTVAPIRDDHGIIQATAAIIEDITERKQAKDALGESELRFRTLVERIGDVFWIGDPTQQKLLYASQAFKEVWGRDLQQVYDHFETWLEAIHEEDRDRVKHEFFTNIYQGQYDSEYRVVRPDGTIRWVRDHGKPLGIENLVAGVAEDITERKQAEGLLTAAKEKLEATLTASDVGVWHWNLITGELVTDANLKRLFAIDSADEQPVEAFLQRIHPDDTAANQKGIDRSISQGDHYDQQFRVQWPDGTIRWIHSRGKVQCDERSKPRIFSGVVLDITARKLTEERLRAAHDTFRYLIEQSPFGLYVVDADFRLAQVSAGAHNVFENVRPLLGRDFAEILRILWPEPFAGDAIARFRHTLETGEPYRSTATVEQRQDIDQVEAYDWRIKRIMLPDGRWGVVCHFYDLTERQKLEAALRESERETKRARDYAEATLRSSPVPLLVLEDDLRVHTGNEAFYKAFKVSSAATQGQSLYDLGNGQWNIPQLRELLEDILPRHTVVQGYEVTHEFETIGLRTMLLNARRMENEAGVPQRIVMVVEDITERKQAEEALQKAQTRLQAWNVELEQAVIAKTAELVHSQERLRAMASELNLAEQRERKRLATELHDHLQQMLVFGKLTIGQCKRQVADIPIATEALKSVDTVLSDALTYSRTLVAELSPPVLREHGMGSGLKWLAEYMEQKHGQRVTVIVSEGEPLTLPEDQRILLFQCVRELLINAAKHAGTGAATVTMTEKEGEVQIQVRDKGRGFDLAAAAAAGIPSGGISSKFGLFSIQERMRALGGTFEIHSALGEGTTATLQLPVKKQPEKKGRAPEPGRTERAALAPAPDTSGGSRIGVLLVDDHIMVRQGLRAVLDAYADIQLVGEAGDGEEAVRLVEQWRPDVVVMDISMPKMSGIEATEQIKKRYPETIIVGLSVNAAGENQEAMKRAGAARLMTKEVAVEQLYGAIHEELKHSAG